MANRRISTTFGMIALSTLVGVARADTAAEKCAVTKIKAAVKKAAAKVACHTKAIKSGEPVDSDCLMKAEDKFSAAFTKAEAKGGCLSSGDTSTVESHVDDFVSRIVADEPACQNPGSCLSNAECCPGTTCQPSPVFPGFFTCQ
jgi:hypothetical protein